MTLPRIDIVCTEEWLGRRCKRLAGHDGMHSDGERTWLFRDPSVPAWVERARARMLPARDLTGSAA